MKNLTKYLAIIFLGILGLPLFTLAQSYNYADGTAGQNFNSGFSGSAYNSYYSGNYQRASVGGLNFSARPAQAATAVTPTTVAQAPAQPTTPTSLPATGGGGAQTGGYIFVILTTLVTLAFIGFEALRGTRRA